MIALFLLEVWKGETKTHQQLLLSTSLFRSNFCYLVKDSWLQQNSTFPQNMCKKWAPFCKWQANHKRAVPQYPVLSVLQCNVNRSQRKGTAVSQHNQGKKEKQNLSEGEFSWQNGRGITSENNKSQWQMIAHTMSEGEFSSPNPKCAKRATAVARRRQFYGRWAGNRGRRGCPGLSPCSPHRVPPAALSTQDRRSAPCSAAARGYPKAPKMPALDPTLSMSGACVVLWLSSPKMFTVSWVSLRATALMGIQAPTSHAGTSI